MEPLDFRDLPEDALVLINSAPIIYFLEAHPKFGPRFKPLFEAHGTGRLRFAVTTITIAEVLTGPVQAGDDALAQRYRAILEILATHRAERRHRGKRGETAGVAPPQACGRRSSGQRIGDQRGRPGDA